MMRLVMHDDATSVRNYDRQSTTLGGLILPDQELAVLYAFNAQAVLPLVLCLYVRARAKQMPASSSRTLLQFSSTVGAGFALLAVTLSFLTMFGFNP